MRSEISLSHFKAHLLAWAFVLAVVPATGAGEAYPGPEASFALPGPSRYLVPLMPPASDPVRQGFVRVVNRSDEPGEVRIDAVDDEGYRYDPVYLLLEANETVHFNSNDLEDGNDAKGLSEGLGTGTGSPRRLELSSELNLEVLSYIRTPDGFVTAMHDIVPREGRRLEVATFNPASNTRQVSRLRLINLGDTEAKVTIRGTDDLGWSPGREVKTWIPAGAVQEFTARDLESGNPSLDGSLGDGSGKWRLTLYVGEPVAVLNLMESPTGHLTNLSAGPLVPDDEHWHLVPFFPGASDVSERQGFLRLRNKGTNGIRLELECHDDEGGTTRYLYVNVDGGNTVHLNSDDLANGNDTKGLYGGTCPDEEAWHIRVRGGDTLEALAYVRTSDGFLTSIHGTVPREGSAHHVATFNPGSNRNQVSRMRLVNPGQVGIEVQIVGVDGDGLSPGDQPIYVTVGPGESLMFEADELETGSGRFFGSLGDGSGKWRLRITAASPVVAMSLLESAGTLTNLSSVAGRAAQIVLSVDENTGPEEPVGEPLTEVGLPPFVLSGPDADAFSIHADTGQIRTVADTAYDHETRVFHWLTVESQRRNRTVHTLVRVDVANMDETPEAPNPPSATSVTDTSTRLLWAEPYDGGATIMDYDYRYRSLGDSEWTEVTDTLIVGTETIVEGLTADGRYEVQIRAVNTDGVGPWSDTASVRLWSPAPDIRVDGPWHFTNIWLTLEDPPDDFDTYCLTLAVETDVYGAVPIYLSPINQKINKLPLYAGIQTEIDGYVDTRRLERRGRGAIFSRWEERDLEAIRIGPNGLHESAGHEGNFLSVRNDLEWTRGSYRLCLVKADQVDGDPLPADYSAEDVSYSWGEYVHTWVRLEVTDEGTGETVFVGALAFPGETLALDGTNTIFYEAYGYGSFAVRDIRSFDVAVRNVTVDGEDVEFSLIREFTNPYHGNGPVMVDSVYRGDGEVSTQVGVFTGDYGNSVRTLYRR